MNKLVRTLIASLLVCLGGAPVAPAAQGDPMHKEGRGKLSYEMDRIARESERGGVKTMSRAYNRAKGTVTVVIELNPGASVEAIKSVVEAAGGRVDGVAANLVKATLAPGALRTVAAQPDVRLVRAPHRPTLHKAGRVGAARSGAARRNDIISQGVNVIGADSFRARTGADGSGIVVGVLDGAFEGAADLLGNELPENLMATDYVLSHLDSPGQHGTACAEIVHDVAPGATLVLGAFEDEVGWSNQIDELVNLGGARIISHSIGFDNLVPADGNNFFSRKVDETVARGVLFVTAAGNEGENYYQGRWSDVNSNRFLDFVGPGGATEMLPVFVGPGLIYRLRWDDSFGRSNHDYDIALVTEAFAGNPDWSEGNPEILAVSADLQNGGQNPVETISFDYPEVAQAYLVVRLDPASAPSTTQRMFLWTNAGVDPAFRNGSSSLSMPGDARGAVTVGAVNWESRGLEGFSSRGPTADNRVKPDVVGPDRVDTFSYGGGAFPGTSAATPHVAGAAALLLSRNPSLSATALRQALERATTSNGLTTAKNNDFGFGLVDLTRAP